MAVKLFKLRDVPDDEADEVREVLSANGITFYETGAGALGVGTPAIWLHDESRLDEAKRLIRAYQERRSAQMRAEYAMEVAEGRHETQLARFRRHPVIMAIFVLAILLILYASLSPFLNFGS